MKRNLGTAVISLLLASSMLFGCSQTPPKNTDTPQENAEPSTAQGNGESDSTEKYTLEVWHAGQQDVKDYLQKYEEINPNVTVKQTVFVDDDYKTQSRVALSGGTTPDVWYTNTGSSLRQFVEAGGLMDITEAATQKGLVDRYDADAIKMDSLDGKLYGLPWSLYTPWMVTWANKEFFEENSLSYPKTVDDLCALAPKMRELGKEPMVFYNKDGWTGAIFFGEYILQQAGPEWIDSINSGQTRWTDNVEAKTALEAMEKMAKAGVFMTGYETQRQDTALPVWKNQDSPLLYNGTWFTQNIGTEFDFTVETLVMPLLTESTVPKAYQNWADWTLGVCPNTKNLEVSLDFLDYATNADFFTMLGNGQGNLSPCTEANEKIDVPYYFNTPPIVDQLDKPKTPFFCYAFPMPVVEVLQSQIKLVMSGQTTVDDALKAIDMEQQRNLQ